MENKFNFNSAICTSREQSERLLKLGLKKETADMYWTKPFNEWFPIVKRGNEKIDDENIPAWGMHRLLRMIALSLNISNGIIELPYDNSYDDCIDRIECLIANNWFNKEYLEE